MLTAMRIMMNETSEVVFESCIFAVGGVLFLWLATANFAHWGASQHTEHVLEVLRHCYLVWCILLVLLFTPFLRHCERDWVIGAYYCVFVLPCTAMLLCSVLNCVLDQNAFHLSELVAPHLAAAPHLAI